MEMFGLRRGRDELGLSSASSTSAFMLDTDAFLVGSDRLGRSLSTARGSSSDGGRS